MTTEASTRRLLVPASDDYPAYVDDALSLPSTLLRMLLTGVAAAILTLTAWFVTGRVDLPAFNSSYVLKALSTAGIILTTLVVAMACYRWLHPRTRSTLRSLLSHSATGARPTHVSRWMQTSLGRVTLTSVCYLAPAALVIASLAVPLAATRLYLDGVSVDQAFRTQFLTRMTDQLSWDDMAYKDLPSFYPGLWFFTGGLFAKLTGVAGWAAFKPWALVTIAATGSMLVPVWQRMSGSLPVATAVAMVTVTITLVIAPEEPYAAIVAMGMPAALIMARRAMFGGRAALAGIIVYLGLSANLYTLFTAISALAVVVTSLLACIAYRSIKPLLITSVIGIGSMAIALLGWAPYLASLFTQPHGPTGKAQHYLPSDGTELPLPFFESPALAVLSLLALIWLVVRYRDGDVRALSVGLFVTYGWITLSMLATLAGTTLLGFRLGLPVAIILGVAGVLAIAEFHLSGLRRLYPETLSDTNARLASRVIAILMALACIGYATSIPFTNQDNIDLAYTDADGEAKRGDRFPADSTTYYRNVDATLMEHFTSRAGTVVLTDEKNFMSFYPYHAFQAMTAHYANPLGQFEERNKEIERWSTITDPQELRDAMDAAERDRGWHKPDAIVMRGQLDLKESPEEIAQLTEEGKYPTVVGAGDGTFTYLIADDIYPNQPNVRFRSLQFHAAAFANGWSLTQVGPFVVAVRDK